MAQKAARPVIGDRAAGNHGHAGKRPFTRLNPETQAKRRRPGALALRTAAVWLSPARLTPRSGFRTLGDVARDVIARLTKGGNQ
jgi:hypothetical protein